MREDGHFFNEHGLIFTTAYWMTAIHIPFRQLNVTSIGLGYNMIFTFSLYPIMKLLEPSLGKDYNVGAQVEINLSNQGNRH